MQFTKEEQEWYEYQRSKQTKKIIYPKDTKETRAEIRKFKREQKALNKLPPKYKVYMKGAKSRKLDFNLSIQQFEYIISLPCIYCGDKDKIGIDRKDNNIGYILSNCQPCCGKCNTFKFKYTEESFLAHIKKVYEFQNTRYH